SRSTGSAPDAEGCRAGIPASGEGAPLILGGRVLLTGKMRRNLTRQGEGWIWSSVPSSRAAPHRLRLSFCSKLHMLSGPTFSIRLAGIDGGDRAVKRARPIGSQRCGCIRDLERVGSVVVEFGLPASVLDVHGPRGAQSTVS